MAEGLSQVLKEQEHYKNCVTGCHRGKPSLMRFDSSSSVTSDSSLLDSPVSGPMPTPRFGKCLNTCKPLKEVIRLDQKKTFGWPMSAAAHSLASKRFKQPCN